MANPTNLSEYYQSIGQSLPSLEERGKIYESSGLGSASDYISKNRAGDINPNTALLGYLTKETTPTSPASSTTKTAPIVAGSSDSVLEAQREEEARKTKEAIENAQRIAAETDQAKLDKIKSEIVPSVTAPTAPNLTATYEELRSSQGVVPIEARITSIRTEKADLLAQLDKFKKAEPVGVSQGFATGRISEEEQNVRDRVDFLTRQENAEIDSLNNKNKYIETVMNLTETDYGNAVTRYNTEFSQNLQMQTAIQNYQSFEQAEENRIRDDARAYLTSVGNMVQNSGKSWDDVDPGMKADITAAELKAGYAPGTLEAFSKSKPNANLIGSRDGYDASGDAITTLIYDDGLGGLKTTIVKTGGTKESDSGVAPSGSLRTVSDIKARLADNPDLTRADLQAEMDKDKTLTQASITSLLDEAGVSPTFPSDSVNEIIKNMRSAIDKKAEGLFNFRSTAVKNMNETVDSGVITFNKKLYRLTDDQKKTIKEGIK